MYTDVDQAIPDASSRPTNPVLEISGEIRRLDFRGFGPFRKPFWNGESFSAQLRSGDRIRLADDVELTCTEAPEGLVIDGTLGETACTFVTIPRGIGAVRKSFTMAGIEGIEFAATVTTLGAYAD